MEGAVCGLEFVGAVARSVLVRGVGVGVCPWCGTWFVFFVSDLLLWMCYLFGAQLVWC